MSVYDTLCGKEENYIQSSYVVRDVPMFNTIYTLLSAFLYVSWSSDLCLANMSITSIPSCSNPSSISPIKTNISTSCSPSWISCTSTAIQSCFLQYKTMLLLSCAITLTTSIQIDPLSQFVTFMQFYGKYVPRPFPTHVSSWLPVCCPPSTPLLSSCITSTERRTLRWERIPLLIKRKIIRSPPFNNNSRSIAHPTNSRFRTRRRLKQILWLRQLFFNIYVMKQTDFWIQMYILSS